MPNVPGELIPIVMFIMAGVTVIGYPIARALARRLENKAIAPRTSPEFEARLVRMENTLESIAIEIERISEGQRFTTKLLSEQSNQRLGSGEPQQPPGGAR